MGYFYQVEGTCKKLDGLLIEGERTIIDNAADEYDVIEVTRFPEQLGSDDPGEPLNTGTLFINVKNVKPVLAASDLASDNPYGDYMYEARYRKGAMEIVYAQFTRGMTVTLLEHRHDFSTRTMDTVSFFGKDCADVRQEIEKLLCETKDVDDIYFVLQDWKNKRRDTNG